MIRLFITKVAIFTLLIGQIVSCSTGSVFAQDVVNLPAPGTMISLSPKFTPAVVSGLTIYPENPLKFDFIIDSGDENLSEDDLAKESKKLINYFLATLAVPEGEMWVNLSPYEKERIVADGLGVTEMGRDMLVQDYMLKQLTASLMYPEEKIGEEFWKKINEKTQAEFGTTVLPSNLFNKIWIVPENAVVHVNGNNVFVSKSYLKVMLEEDYLASEVNRGSTRHGLGDMDQKRIDKIGDKAKEAIREILIPQIEREVNEGKNFANLKQIYNSMILATWYKKNLKESVLGKFYADSNKIRGIDLENKLIKEQIYTQYVQAFERGAYNLVKDEYNPVTQEIVTRKYFSGGLLGYSAETIVEGNDQAMQSIKQSFEDANVEYRVGFEINFLDKDGSILSLDAPDVNLDEAMSADANREVNIKQDLKAKPLQVELEVGEAKILVFDSSWIDNYDFIYVFRLENGVFIRENGNASPLRLNVGESWDYGEALYDSPGSTLDFTITATQAGLSVSSQSEREVELNIRNSDLTINDLAKVSLDSTEGLNEYQDFFDILSLDQPAHDTAVRRIRELENTLFLGLQGLWEKSLLRAGNFEGLIRANQRRAIRMQNKAVQLDYQTMWSRGRYLEANWSRALELLENGFTQKIDFQTLAEKTRQALEDVRQSSKEYQMDKLKQLMQSREFAVEMASWLEGAYYRGIGETAPAFIGAEMSDAQAQEKVAINLAGFYALETGLGFILELEQQRKQEGEGNILETPMDIIDSIIKQQLSDQYMLLLARFANATWKAGQPFRDLGRIKRDNFIPAGQLSNIELEKDFVQIKEAALKLRDGMTTPSRNVDEGKDSASLSNPGGIDLNPNLLKLATTGDSVRYELDGSQFPPIDTTIIQSIKPVIIDISPIFNFSPLLD